MEHDLDQFVRDLDKRMKWLLRELKRLSAENERLLRENEALREEATLARLQTKLGSGSELPEELVPQVASVPALSAEALQFYRKLPDKINFSEFFQYAESDGLSTARAREFMLSFFRQDLLEQRGRRLEKSRAASGAARRGVQGA